MKNQIISSAEPFFLPGDRTGILLTHGFTGTPKEMIWLGQYLNHELGFTCLGVRLAGHATRPKDMVRSRWTDWTASVEDGCDLLRGSVDDLYLVGLSMGGALSLMMSTRFTPFVKGVVAMSTPYEVPGGYPAWQIRLYSYFKTYIHKMSETPGSGWFDQEAFKEQVSYPMNPVRSAAELNILLEKMRSALPKVSVPVMLIHSKDDTYVPAENMERIYTDLRNAPVKDKLYITGSGHVVTRDAARHQVFIAVGEFIERTRRMEKPVES